MGKADGLLILHEEVTAMGESIDELRVTGTPQILDDVPS